MLSQALEGFLLAKRIEGLSPRTLEGYERQIERLSTFLDNPSLDDITADDLRHDYTPQRRNSNSRHITRTVFSYATAAIEFTS